MSEVFAVGKKIVLVPCLFAIMLVAGCTRNTTLVVNGQLPAANTRAAALAKAGALCKLSPDEASKYSTAATVAMPTDNASPKIAKDNHIDGCAVVEYQLDKDGNPINWHVIRESPVGYGFGDAVVQRMKDVRYKPPVYPENWHMWSGTYVNSTTLPATPAAAAPTAGTTL